MRSILSDVIMLEDDKCICLFAGPIIKGDSDQGKCD